MANEKRKIKVVAVGKDYYSDYFDIFLEKDGERVYLMPHRSNGMLYRYLERGVSLDEMKRYKPKYGGKGGAKLSSMVQHVCKVVEYELKHWNDIYA